MSRPLNGLPDGYQYWAFISYSRHDNREIGKRWGEWLQEALETYRFPEALVGTAGGGPCGVPSQLSPVFRDETDLASAPDLPKAICEALRESLFLVVICSPCAARSEWVNREILYFRELEPSRRDRILPLIIDGEPNATVRGTPELECFPDALRLPANPLAADFRLHGRRADSLESPELAPVLHREKLRLIAGIAGLDFDQLFQREQQREVQRQLKEKAARAQEARDLFDQGEEQWRHLEALKRRETKQIFERLGAAEDLFSRAAQKDPKLVAATRRLQEVRITLVETAIRSKDLNMAAVFLVRLEQMEGVNVKEANDRLSSGLEEAWRESDPASHPRLIEVTNIGLVAPVIGALWSLLLLYLFLYGGEGSGEAVSPWTLFSAIIALEVVLIPSLIFQKWIALARGGDQEYFGKSFLVSNITWFLGLLTLNLPVFLGFARVAVTLASKDFLKIVWRNH